MGAIAGRYDPWAEFARVHLSSATERATYLAVAGERRSWSAKDLARERNLGLEEAEAVLLRFAKGGIVNVTEGEDGERYRWREEMDFIFGERSGTLGEFDPVCGTPITAPRPLTTSWDGTSYAFCSPLCRAAFLVSPTLFASSSLGVA